MLERETTSMVKIEPFKYKEGAIPEGYICGKCGAKGCRLWRPYQTFLDGITLLCANCAEKDQKKELELEVDRDYITCDQIGWFVPAVPTEEGDTYWGYTSVPRGGCDWWDSLPIRPGQKPPKETLTPYMKREFLRLRSNYKFLQEVLGEFAAHARKRLAEGLPPEEIQINRAERFSK